MAETSGRKHRRIAARAAAAALTAALVATGTSAVAADAPQPSLGAAAGQPSAAASAAAAAVTPTFALYGVNSSGTAYSYAPNGAGGLSSRDVSGSGWVGVSAMSQVDNQGDGKSDGLWFRESNGDMGYLKFDSSSVKIGYGWNIYNKIVSTGNIGGAAAGDLLTRTTNGDLYVYLGYGTGKLTGRIKVGYGWDIYSEIAGNGDLNGDGKNDVVARDKSGVLWLYKGTGNQKAPFSARTKVGSGWNTYNKLVSTGDLDLDGRTDLVARNSAGELYLYKGTGNAAAPYKAKVRIGTSGWNSYKFLF
ncbi:MULTISPECIES: VCBS repeat-containing protein [unclassified Streptomyces]|uniref:FG-GAP repeat domain-containing protein n=1 Tax=unclassified Streptomyces TaxID=2593676 RepID=UPI0020338241|nr:VCBS repeat-containing protein [Streptomyces sp. RKAG290]MCM2411061.1 VCBS repeat-containing protein [Streptomyces sp. RKAG290]